MDIYDIIKEKDWAELTESEMNLIKDLAADEKEFNLLKIMMLVSRDEKESVPDLPGQVYQEIIKQLPQKNRKIVSRRWMLAAASVFGIAMLTVYFINQNTSNPVFVDTHPDTTPTKEQIASKPEIKNAPMPQPAEVSTNSEAKQKRMIAKHRVTKKPFEDKQHTSAEDISMSVSSQPELLSLVVEFY